MNGFVATTRGLRNAIKDLRRKVLMIEERLVSAGLRGLIGLPLFVTAGASVALLAITAAESPGVLIRNTTMSLQLGVLHEALPPGSEARAGKAVAWHS